MSVAQPVSAKASPVLMRFGVHEGYDRLVLEWPEAIRTHLSVERGTAVITFSSGARLDVQRLNNLVAPVMRPVRLSADGTQLSFHVPAGRSVLDRTNGHLMIVDLVSHPAGGGAETAAGPPASETVPPSEAAPATLPAEREAISIVVPRPNVGAAEDSTGENSGDVLLGDTADGKLRVTGTPLEDGVSFQFRWDAHVKAAVFKLGTTLWIVFNDLEQVNLHATAARAGSIPRLTQVDNPLGTVLKMTVGGGARIITSRVDNAWLVDVRDSKAAPASDADSGTGEILKNDGNLFRTKKPAPPIRIVDPDSGAVLMAVPVRTAGAHFDRAAGFDNYTILPTSQGMLFRSDDDSIKVVAEADGARVARQLSPEGFSEVVLAETADHQLRVSATPIQDGFSFQFRWGTAARAAIFKLRTSVWVVFDRHVRLAFNPEASGAEHIPAMSQVDNLTGTVLRFAVPANYRVNAGSVENAWVVDLRQPTKVDRDSEAAVAASSLTSDRGLFRTPTQPGQPITLVDPESGEILIAIPLLTSGARFEQASDFKTYIALPTCQGMLFRPEGDTARFLIEQDGVRVVNAVATLETNQ